MKGKNKKIFKKIFLVILIFLNFIFLGNKALAAKNLAKTREIKEYHMDYGREKISKLLRSLFRINKGLQPYSFRANKSAMRNSQDNYKIKLKIVTIREGYRLTGGKIEIYSEDYTYIRDWYPDTEPELSLKPGTYWLWQTGGNEGYAFFSGIKLTVRSNGGLEMEEDTSTYLDGNTIVFKALRKVVPSSKSFELIISKLDAEGNYLPGANFKIYEKTKPQKYDFGFISLRSDRKVYLNRIDTIGATYIIKEVEAPVGFEKILDIEIKIPNYTELINGKKDTAILVSNPNGERVKLEGNKLIIKNKRKERKQKKEKEVYLTKINDFSKRVAGGVFRVYKANDLKNAIAELTSTGYGDDVKIKLEYGKEYIVKETKSPEGYSIVNFFKVSVSNTGVISISGNDNNVRLEGDKLIIKEPFRKYPVNIKKVDENGKALGGVKFNIYSKKADGNYSLDDTWNSNTEYSKNLIPNEYKIEEISTPEGYSSIDPFEFEVKPNGQIEPKVTNPDVSVDNKTFTITIKNKYKQNLIKISKVDQNGDLLNSNSNPAKLRLSSVINRRSKSIKTWLTNEQPTFTLGEGLYNIREIHTPIGYKGTGKIVFEVTDKGKVVIKSDSSNVIVSDSANNIIEIKVINRQKKDIIISKIDPEGNALAGARFGIYEKNDQTKSVKSLKSETSDQTLSLECGKTYIIKEEEAPLGFEKVLDFEISIDKDCNISLVSNPNGENVKLVGGKLIIKDKYKKYPIKISKIDQNGKLVNGNNNARLKIFSIENKVEKPISGGEWDTKAQPTFDFKAGTYKIKEIKTPSGYEGTGDILFEVKHGGGIEIKSNSSNVIVSDLADKSKEIKVINRQKKDVLISKVDPERKALAGAKFDIYEKIDPIQKVASLTSGAGDQTVSLVCGKTYTIKESQAPVGYEKISDFDFEISNNGILKLLDTPNGVSIDGNRIVIVDNLKKHIVKFKKVDEKNNQLNDAVLEVYNQNNTCINSWTTDKIAEIPLEPGVYKLRETKTPKGYESIPEVTFTVNSDGSVTLGDNGNISIVGNLIIVTNKKKNIPPPPKRTISVTVHKLLLGKKEFDGWQTPKGYDASQNKTDFDKLVENAPKEISGVYFVWKNDKDQFIDSEGNVVDSIDKALGKLTGPEGATFDTSKLPNGNYKIYEVKEKSTYTGEDGKVLTESKASPIEIKLPVINKNGVVEDVHVYPKNTENKPQIDKNFDETVTDPDVDNKLDLENYQRPKSKINRTIGDVIPYAVKTVIPIGSEYKKLTWTDNMTNGLTYDKNISIDGANLTSSDYIKSEDERGFSLSLKDSGLEKVRDACKTADVVLMIKYSASLNAKAVINLAKPQENTIALDYSNSPGKSYQPLDINPLNGKIKVDKSWVTGGNKQIPFDDKDLAVTYILEEKVGDVYKEIKAVTLRNSEQNPAFDYEFTGLSNQRTYRIRERVGGYEPNYVSYNQGVLSITNIPNKTYLRPSNSKVETCGKKFVKVNTEDERLFGAIFAIKKDGKYLKAKSLGRRTQDKEELKKAKDTLCGALDAYSNLKSEELDTEAGTKAKKLIEDSQKEYDKAFENEGIGFELTDKSDDPDLIKLASNEDGQFMIRGLGAGSYELEELRAPKGYGKFNKIDFEINVMSFNNGNIKYSNEDSVDNATKVINRKVIIPQAGGLGSLIFMVVGLCVMIYALFNFRKRSIY
ncbi:SpaA isopeptide-forming pilin-related protein [Anaerococcus lactolyticus]|uniref:SpaA isopeptide-forming pilin-related protein n=1 Tax=Anaerococcus lactolyticus TaxID=33032 RepID=UPI00068C40D9|nr:SpaA isopeptide-forming pilin-related protein [Anaerococcus lactolyticus]